MPMILCPLGQQPVQVILIESGPPFFSIDSAVSCSLRICQRPKHGVRRAARPAHSVHESMLKWVAHPAFRWRGGAFVTPCATAPQAHSC